MNRTTWAILAIALLVIAGFLVNFWQSHEALIRSQHDLCPALQLSLSNVRHPGELTGRELQGYRVVVTLARNYGCRVD